MARQRQWPLIPMRTSFLAAVKAGPFRHLVAKNLHLSGDRIAVCFSRIVRYLNLYFEDGETSTADHFLPISTFDDLVPTMRRTRTRDCLPLYHALSTPSRKVHNVFPSTVVCCFGRCSIFGCCPAAEAINPSSFSVLLHCFPTSTFQMVA